MLPLRRAESSLIPWFTPPSLFGAGLDDLLAVAGALVSMAWARRAAGLAGLPPRRLVDGLALVFALGIVLGHALDVALYRPDALGAGWSVLLPWRGGYCSLGAALGTLLAIGIAFRKEGGGLRWDLLDLLVPSVLLGLAVVRLGCFLGHHHAGRLSNFPLAVAYPGGARHDLGLYEAHLALALFAGALLVRRRWRPAAGTVALGTTGAFAVGRFLVETVRGEDLEVLGRHSDPRYFGFTLVQVAALASAAACLVWIAARASHPAPPATPADPRPPTCSR